MKIQAFKISAIVEQSCRGVSDISTTLGIAIARTVAYHLPLTTSRVDNPYVAFDTTAKAEALSILNDINEAYVIKIDDTLDLIQRLWVMRYRLVFEPSNEAVNSFITALMTVGSRELQPEISKFLAEEGNADAVNRTASALNCLLECNNG